MGLVLELGDALVQLRLLFGRQFGGLFERLHGGRDLFDQGQVALPQLTGLAADLRVVYELGEIHHDVILRERPNPELLARLGFQEEHLRIEVWTEFFEAPEPSRTLTILRQEPDATLRQRMAEPDLVDEALDFGELRFGSGRAFAESPERTSGAIGVAKQFFVTSVGRTPPRPPSGKPVGEILIAGIAPRSEPGVVIDFVALSGTYSAYVFSNQTYQITGTVNLGSSVTFEGGAVIKFNPGTKLSVLHNTQIICATDPYSPVVMTARDDNTVGAIVQGSTGTVSGTYANPALEISRSSYASPGELDRIRILHAATGIFLSGSHYGTGPTFRDLQLIQCTVGIGAYGAGSIKVLNGLFHKVDRAFSSLYSTTVYAQHLTVHDGSWFNFNPSGSYIHLVNSLLVKVTNSGYYSGVSVGLEIDGASVFEPVGAGWHYLRMDSLHRNVGVTSIDSGLASRLKRQTTYAPEILAGPITVNTVLEPRAWRDMDVPNRGYHYDPVDYAVNTLQVVQSASLTLTNGVVLATYGQNGLWLNSGAVLRSVGRPADRNHIVRFNTVMEQPLNWGGGGPYNHVVINPYHTSGTAPVVQCRFTDFSLLAHAGFPIYTSASGWVISNLTLQDCAFRGGALELAGPAGTAVHLRNNLLLSASTSLSGAYALQAYNNLFRRGFVLVDHSSGSWVLKDNVLDRCEILDFSLVPVTHSHNVYVSTVGRIGTPQTGDVTLANLLYYQRDLGRYYQHTSSSLRNAGSRLATAAGLAHYTATSDYAKDTGMVDIGLHYVATVNGLPIDTDGDGLADYVEDANGNGVVDAGETDWTNPDTDGDGLSDGAEVNATGTDPLNPNDAGSHNLPSLTYSIDNATKISRKTWEGTMPITRTFLVKRGTDALRVWIDMATEETPPENYPYYNDRLTYRIQSPLLPGIQGTFQLTQLGSQPFATIFPPEWFNCHSKTVEADSYVTVTLTAENVNGGNRHSSIGVAIAALRVDFDPIQGSQHDDRLVFGTEMPQGKLQVNLLATVMPSDAYALDYLTGCVRFEVEAIGDSNLQWGAAGGLGIYNGSGQFTNTATFHGLPTSNGAFGPKIARLFINNRWELDSQQQIRVFYPADAFNHPVGAPSYGNRPRNYFYYYMQTAAGIPSTAYGPFYDGHEDKWGQSHWEPQYPYRYYGAYHQTQRHPPGQYIDQPGVNGGAQLTYIDLFAWALRHERSHHLNWMWFWAPDDVPMQGHWRDRDHHKHVQFLGDWLPDDQEGYMEAEGGPYSPTHTDSHPEDEYDRWYEFRDDHQRHNCNSFNAVVWPVGSANAQDWACPGNNWPQ
jgi:hypothetical protein